MPLSAGASLSPLTRTTRCVSSAARTRSRSPRRKPPPSKVSRPASSPTRPPARSGSAGPTTEENRTMPETHVMLKDAGGNDVRVRAGNDLEEGGLHVFLMVQPDDDGEVEVSVSDMRKA